MNKKIKEIDIGEYVPRKKKRRKNQGWIGMCLWCPKCKKNKYQHLYKWGCECNTCGHRRYDEHSKRK